MSERFNSVTKSIAKNPKATTTAWLVLLLLVEVGGVVAEGGTTGP